VNEAKEGIGKTESEDKREPRFERKEELRFELREEERLDDGLLPQPVERIHFLRIQPHLQTRRLKHHKQVKYGERKKDKKQANNIQKGSPFTTAAPIRAIANPG
jgi:hypothetical protein